MIYQSVVNQKIKHFVWSYIKLKKPFEFIVTIEVPIGTIIILFRRRLGDRYVSNKNF